MTGAHGSPIKSSSAGVASPEVVYGSRVGYTPIRQLSGITVVSQGKVGRPRRRPRTLYADRGYDHDCHRREVRAKRVRPIIGRRGTSHGSGLGVHRWVVERTIALLHWFRRLRIRWEIRDDIHEVFMTLALAIICRRRLTR